MLSVTSVVAGRAVVDGMDLPEGFIAAVLTPEADEEVHLTAEDEARLLGAVAEVERGETISAEELFERLERIAKL